jgi:hypothetical protein
MERIPFLFLIILTADLPHGILAQNSAPDFTVHQGEFYAFIYSSSPQEVGYPNYPVGMEWVRRGTPVDRIALQFKNNAILPLDVYSIYQFLYAFPPRSPKHFELDSLRLPTFDDLLKCGYAQIPFRRGGIKHHCMAVCLTAQYFTFTNTAVTFDFVVGVSDCRLLWPEEEKAFKKNLRVR